VGALVEKDITTPDYYPLSLNALIKRLQSEEQSRTGDELDEGAVRQALGRPAGPESAGPAGGADSA